MYVIVTDKSFFSYVFIQLWEAIKCSFFSDIKVIQSVGILLQT